MVASNARQVLQEENKLLTELEKRSTDFANNNSGLAQTIFSGWAGSFRAHRSFNEELIAGDDAYFDRWLDEERALMQELLSVTRSKGSSIRDSWAALFKEESDILDRLRK